MPILPFHAKGGVICGSRRSPGLATQQAFLPAAAPSHFRSGTARLSNARENLRASVAGVLSTRGYCVCWGERRLQLRGSAGFSPASRSTRTEDRSIQRQTSYSQLGNFLAGWSKANDQHTVVAGADSRRIVWKKIKTAVSGGRQGQILRLQKCFKNGARDAESLFAFRRQRGSFQDLVIGFDNPHMEGLNGVRLDGN